jgi:predicted nucleic acid-binding protein
MKTALIDANVILRFLTKDPPAMAEAALKLFKKADAGEVILTLHIITVAEVVWVLESFYQYPKGQIAHVMEEFLNCDGLIVENEATLRESLELYRQKNLDFADALLAVTAIHSGVPTIYSFDHHFDRVEGITRLAP